MIEKIIISVLKALSGIFFIVIMLTLFSIPVIFIYQAFMPPVFSFENIIISEEVENDEFLISQGESSDGWASVDYKLSASSGKYSPYSYKIDEFMLDEDYFNGNLPEYKVRLDDTVEFTNTESDSFTLTLYIKKNGTDSINEVLKSVSFKAKTYEKSFSEFSVTYEEE